MLYIGIIAVAVLVARAEWLPGLRIGCNQQDLGLGHMIWQALLGLWPVKNRKSDVNLMYGQGILDWVNVPNQ